MKRSVARALAPPTLCTSFVDPFVAIYDRNRRMIVALWGPVWVEPILPMKHVWPTGDLGRGRFHPKPFLYRY